MASPAQSGCEIDQFTRTHSLRVESGDIHGKRFVLVTPLSRSLREIDASARIQS